MAQRLKTLWYATQIAADVADATQTALTQITVYAENSSRTFRSCLVWVNFSGMSTVTGNTVTEHRVTCSVNGAGATTFTETDDLANTGENVCGRIGPVDFTAHFVSNFPAANSATLDIGVYLDMSTGTGLTSNNVSAIIAITYEYDDSAATQYATMIIPMESNTGALATSETELGTNQIPQLTGSGGLCENVASFTVLQQFFLLEGNVESAGGSGAGTMNIRIDSGTTHTYSAEVRTLASDTYHTYLHVESPSTSAVHAFKAWCTTTALFNMIMPTMYVTYSFAKSGTTKFLNSIMIPFDIPSPMGGTTSSDASRFSTTFFLEEPGTLTLKQSAYRVGFMPGAGNLGGLNSRAGSQAFRAYTATASVICGGSNFQQRIDSGGAQGAGITIARGINTFNVDCYRTDSTDLGWNVSGLLILNYLSDVSAQGPAAHAHTVAYLCAPWDALLTVTRVVSTAAGQTPNIPESDYWITAAGFQIIHWDANATTGLNFDFEVGAGEGEGDGWRSMYRDIAIKDSEICCQVMYCRGSAEFKRWPSDFDTNRLDIETQRRSRYSADASVRCGIAWLFTYHTITFTVDGTVSGSAAGTVDIDVYRENGADADHVASTSRSGNGAYSVTVYDNVYDHFAEAYESGTLIGRSNNAKPNGTA